MNASRRSSDVVIWRKSDTQTTALVLIGEWR